MAQYSLDPLTANCYPDTTVLVNKLGIQDETRLSEAETNITQGAAVYWDMNPLLSTFDFEHYRAIHKHLFVELYDWAGRIRDVDISKKGTKFCPHGNIEDLADRIFTRLASQHYLAGMPKGRFIAEFIDLCISTNYLHPFREGNGRAQRLFLSQLARNAGYGLDFADIDTDELMIATIQSTNGVSDGLVKVFNDAVYNPKSVLQRIKKAEECSDVGDVVASRARTTRNEYEK